MSKITLGINLSGGVIQDVFVREPGHDIEVVVIDYDDEVEGPDTVDIPQDGTEYYSEGVVTAWSPQPWGSEAWWNEVLELTR